ncbi:MAG: glycosyltransferase family 4 protein [Actinomycetes bacterium]|jgi:glycogen(starch) synthase
MRIYWYWPHPHRTKSGLAIAVQRPGDDLVVQALSAYRGENLPPLEDGYSVVRDLPDPAPPGRSDFSRIKRTWVTARARRAQLESRFDIAHIENLVYWSDPFDLRAALRGTPSVGVVHDVWPHHSRVPRMIQRTLHQRLYSSVDHLIVYHDALKQKLGSEFGVDGSRVSTLPIPMPSPILSPKINRHGPVRVLFLGSFRRNKGIGLLLESIRSIGNDPSIEFVIAGAGEPELERLVYQASLLHGNITAEIGWYSESRKLELLSSCDWLVLPYSDFNSQSGVLRDAYAAQRPSVACDVGALGPTIREEGTGILVPPNSSSALAEVLASLVRVSAEDYGPALTAAAQKHSEAVVGKQLRQIYEDVAKLDRRT